MWSSNKKLAKICNLEPQNPKANQTNQWKATRKFLIFKIPIEFQFASLNFRFVLMQFECINLNINCDVKEPWNLTI